MITRVCKDCKEEKSLEDLVIAKACLQGVRKLCKACNVIRVQKRSDKDKKAAYDKLRRSEKGEELRAYDRVRSKLPSRKATHNESTRKRRAMLKLAVPENYDREGVISMYKLAQKITSLTGVEMHVDHIVSLARGGVHDTPNLQLLAGTLNIAKGTKPHFQLDRKVYK